MSEQKKRTPAVVYSYLYPDVVRVCRELGYAVALHGSMTRDLDIIAIPWTEEAVEAETLVDAVAHAVYGQFVESYSVVAPVDKPHGRRAWEIHLHNHCYIDFSVMPLRAFTSETKP